MHIFLVVKRVTHVEQRAMSAICCHLSGALLVTQVISIFDLNNFVSSLGKILSDLPFSPNSSFSPQLSTFWGPPQLPSDLYSLECQHFAFIRTAGIFMSSVAHMLMLSDASICDFCSHYRGIIVGEGRTLLRRGGLIIPHDINARQFKLQKLTIFLLDNQFHLI